MDMKVFKKYDLVDESYGQSNEALDKIIESVSDLPRVISEIVF